MYLNYRLFLADAACRRYLVQPVAGSYRIDRKHYLVTHSANADKEVMRQIAPMDLG